MITTIAFVLTVIVALQHVGFLYLEMFLWSKPTGQKIFRMTPELSKQTAALGANQGLYNGFLAVALFLSLFVLDPYSAQAMRLYGLSCVVIAGIYGAYSVSYRILIIQALPAALALAFTLWAQAH